MKKIFYLDGGAGRVLAGLPAFLKYAKNNPGDDWGIIIPAWDALYWGFPELQDRTFGADTKGIFDTVIKNCEKIVTVEPYRQPGYFTQKLSLSEAIDIEVNETTDHSDLGPPRLVISNAEETFAKNSIEEIKKAQKKQKTIIVQPFGRGAKIDKVKGNVFDEESRSLSSHDYLFIVKKLALKYNLIFFGEPDFHLQADVNSAKFMADLRQWAALVKEADYFIGCDSVGQHIARAVDTPGTIIFGSTFPINTSYPNYFQIIENSKFKKYSPIRITGLDCMLANRLNEGCMKFTEAELNDICNKITNDIEKKVKNVGRN